MTAAVFVVAELLLLMFMKYLLGPSIIRTKIVLLFQYVFLTLKL